MPRCLLQRLVWRMRRSVPQGEGVNEHRRPPQRHAGGRGEPYVFLERGRRRGQDAIRPAQQDRQRNDRPVRPRVHRLVRTLRSARPEHSSDQGHPPSPILLPNDRVSQLATNTVSIPQDAIAILLQRLVLATLLSQSPPDPQGISASIYGRNNHQHAFTQRVVDAKTKSL